MSAARAAGKDTLTSRAAQCQLRAATTVASVAQPEEPIGRLREGAPGRRTRQRGSPVAQAPRSFPQSNHRPSGAGCILRSDAIWRQNRADVFRFVRRRGFDKLPRELHLVDEMQRSPAGKADYQWAKRVATAEPAATDGVNK